MLKIKYNISMLFQYKKYNDSHLCCQSYTNIQPYAIRSAILGSIIQLEGIEKAKELFYKVKNSNIYIKDNNAYNINSMMLLLFANSHYKGSNIGCQQIGAKEKAYIDCIEFYIDNLIPDIELYLKNIEWLGSSDSLVYLDSIEKVDNMNNVYMKYECNDDVKSMIVHDWDSKITFDDVYMYSDKRNHRHSSNRLYLKDEVEL